MNSIHGSSKPRSSEFLPPRRFLDERERERESSNHSEARQCTCERSLIIEMNEGELK